ncbi:MAG: NAD(P)/FAD-dependent oxidoreductase [Mycobacteriales bacterium]
MSVAIIGAGFSGLGMAVQLKRAGITDLVVLERSDDVGGVWRDNTYPGAACDVPSHLYSFSFAPEGRWSKRFAEQPEIHAYLQRVARDHGVLPHVRFGTEVTRAEWDEDEHHWRLTTSTGQVHVADVVVAACGQLSRPAYPDVPGLQDFAGTTFHSARWDHGHDVSGRRVVVLGTGASAIQFVPEVARRAAHVTVLQRTAPYVLRKPDRDYGPRTKALLARHPVVLKADRLRTFVTNEARSLGFNTQPRLLKGHQLRFLRQLRKEIPDPELRARVTPTDPIGCKRILQSNDWFPALRRPNVSVVTEPVVRVRPEGVETADGVVHEADTLVLGTGFAATELLVPMEVVGLRGTLREAWAQGAEAYLGSAVAGFPNLFLLYGPNTNLGHNSIILMLESQFRWIVQAVQLARHGAAVEVRADVQERYNAWLQQRLKRTVFAGGCRSWYLTASGRNTQNWPGSTVEFRLRTRRLRREDLVVRPARRLALQS